MLAISILYLVFVLLRVRRGEYLLKYALLWVFLSILGVFFAAFPQCLVSLAHLLGFSVPSNFVYFALIVFLLISNLMLCGVLSRQEIMLKSIAQELSIMKSEAESHNDTQGA